MGHGTTLQYHKVDFCVPEPRSTVFQVQKMSDSLKAVFAAPVQGQSSHFRLKTT